MTYPTFYDPTLERTQPGQDFSLSGPEAHHAVNVRRVKVGERIDVVNGHGLRIRAQVDSAEREHLSLTALRVTNDPAPGARIMLVQALAKGGRDESAIEASTEVGVDGVIAWQADRSVVQWRGAKRDKGLQRWHKVLVSAMKQSRRSHLPHLAGYAHGKEIIDLLPHPCHTFVLHEQSQERLTQADLPAQGWIVIVVGPEGGITESELRAFTLRDHTTMVRLGSEILRASTAGPAAISVLNHRLGRW